jgi:hypothetical protein
VQRARLHARSIASKHMMRRSSGSGEPAAPRRQSLLREQARYALLPAATPRLSLLP